MVPPPGNRQALYTRRGNLGAKWEDVYQNVRPLRQRGISLHSCRTRNRRSRRRDQARRSCCVVPNQRRNVHGARGLHLLTWLHRNWCSLVRLVAVCVRNDDMYCYCLLRSYIGRSNSFLNPTARLNLVRRVDRFAAKSDSIPIGKLPSRDIRLQRYLSALGYCLNAQVNGCKLKRNRGRSRLLRNFGAEVEAHNGPEHPKQQRQYLFSPSELFLVGLAFGASKRRND